MMKKVIFLFTFVVLLSACTQIENTVEPEKTQDQLTLLKLPAKSSVSKVETQFTVSKSVDGDLGGTLEFNFDYKSVNGSVVGIVGNLNIPAGAFNGTKNIEIIVDDENAVVDCYPTPTTFAKPLKLTLTYTNINIENVNENNLDFYYIKDNNSSVENLIKADKVIDKVNNTLSVIEVELPHFTRFGWVI